MIEIDLRRLRDALPKNAEIKLKYWFSFYDEWIDTLEFIVNPSLLDETKPDRNNILLEVHSWQEDIIGNENIISVTYNELGRNWEIHLKNNNYKFINVLDNEVMNYDGKSKLIKHG